MYLTAENAQTNTHTPRNTTASEYTPDLGAGELRKMQLLENFLFNLRVEPTAGEIKNKLTSQDRVMRLALGGALKSSANIAVIQGVAKELAEIFALLDNCS